MPKTILGNVNKYFRFNKTVFATTFLLMQILTISINNSITFKIKLLLLKKKLYFLVIENVVNKIREFRKKKGYSHEKMAHELNMSQPAYSKIEKNETKFSVERLFEIANILETPVEKFLEINPNNVYNQDLKDNAVGHQEVQTIYQDNKEKSEKIEIFYEARLKDKDLMINQLQKIIDRLG